MCGRARTLRPVVSPDLGEYLPLIAPNFAVIGETRAPFRTIAHPITIQSPDICFSSGESTSVTNQVPEKALASDESLPECRLPLSAQLLPLYPTQSGHSILLEELPTLTHTRHENRFVAKCDSVGGYFLGGENPT